MGTIVIEYKRAEQETGGGLWKLWAPNRAKALETIAHCIVERAQIIHFDIIFFMYKVAIISTIW